ncbi:membrane protein [Ensifer adhaerens]|uniref:Membrane protein n=1 Tax=Ensifer adhaerens TaxID=106592 RepID=A0A0L8C3T5_ENSAD|nr:membrane protein [Ensifer adhaerens]
MATSRRRDPSASEYLAAHGGPFFELQRRLGLLHEHSLKTGRRAVLFIALAWLVPLLLGFPRSFLAADTPGSYLGDLGVWGRFVVGIGAFVLAEQQVERGLRIKLGQFLKAPLIAPGSVASFGDAVTKALERRDSRIAEAVCLVLAIAAAVVALANAHTATVSSWAVEVSAAGNRLTATGWWVVFVSQPLFIFLLLRGLWRHLVWAQLLRRIARLELRLVATHPDGNGGLGFLAGYPNAYVLFIFGVSAAIGAAIAKHLLQESLTTTTFSMIATGWLVIVIALFAYPLSAFSKPLAELKERSLLMLGSQATRYQRLNERKIIGTNVAAASADEAQQQADDTADPTKQYETTRKLSAILLSRTAIVPVAAAALLPIAAAGATILPYKEVFSVLKKLLLL